MTEKITAPRVVLFWATLNALAAGILLLFGERDWVMIWTAGMVGSILVTAGVVWLSLRHQERRQTWRLPASGEPAVLLALTGLVMGLAFALYIYLALIAVVPFTFAVLKELSARRGGLF